MRLLALTLFAASTLVACIIPTPQPERQAQAPQEEKKAVTPEPAATLPPQEPVADPAAPEAPKTCGGIVGSVCPKGSLCTDDPSDSCDPKQGGRDCMGICTAPKKECKPVLCRMYCKNGWQVGPDGCEICACAP